MCRIYGASTVKAQVKITQSLSEESELWSGIREEGQVSESRGDFLRVWNGITATCESHCSPQTYGSLCCKASFPHSVTQQQGSYSKENDFWNRLTLVKTRI